MSVCERYLSIEQVLEILPVSEAFLAKARASGGGPPFCRMGSRVLYPYSGLMQFMESRIVSAPIPAPASDLLAAR